MEYVIDEYVQPEHMEGTPNVDCVLSWRERDGELRIDFRNGWVYDSERWAGRAGAREAMLPALRRNQAGKLGGGSKGIATDQLR